MDIKQITVINKNNDIIYRGFEDNGEFKGIAQDGYKVFVDEALVELDNKNKHYDVNNIQELEDIFNDALIDGYGVGVEVTIPNQDDTEFILNKHESIKNKLEYYKKTYDENLVHRHCKDIKIISAFSVNFDEED